MPEFSKARNILKSAKFQFSLLFEKEKARQRKKGQICVLWRFLRPDGNAGIRNVVILFYPEQIIQLNFLQYV